MIIERANEDVVKALVEIGALTVDADGVIHAAADGVYPRKEQ